MSKWDYFNIEILKRNSNPIHSCGKCGYPIYDPLFYHNHPLYYGAIVVDKKVAEVMRKNNVNGGYSYTTQKTKTIALRTKNDYEDAIQYPHYARVVFPKANMKLKSKDMVISDYPELEQENVNLYELLQQGISIKQLCSVYDITEDEALQRCYKSLINNIG